MSMDKKLLFFDIDGTLVDFNNNIDEKVIKALIEAKARGHELFLCTGRSRCQIDERLAKISFDGMITAAGVYTEYHGKLIHAEYIPENSLRKLIGFFENEKIAYILQCSDRMVFESYCLEKINELFGENFVKTVTSTQKIMDIMAVEDNILKRIDEYTNAEKLCYYDAHFDIEEISKILAPEFEVTEMSFGNRGLFSGEVTLNGINKAFGMRKIIEEIDAKREDTIAFGDGANDMDMLEFAGVGVAMGNSSDNLKNIANIVANDIDKDGIVGTLSDLGIIFSEN